MAADKDGDGIVEEDEIGSLDSGGGKIDTETEMAAIDGVIITLHVAAIRKPQRDNVQIVDDVKSQIVPRAIGLFRQNGIIGLADPTDDTNIN
jgi:hypothetical protein